jgi:uncharacterized membrane protein YkoI
MEEIRMRSMKKLYLAGAAAVTVVAAVVVAARATDAVATDGDDREPAISGEALAKASAAALAHTGGGRVTDTEAGDEESYYEVEVTLDDGTQVDVQLDEQFNVVDSEADAESEDESGDDD